MAPKLKGIIPTDILLDPQNPDYTATMSRMCVSIVHRQMSVRDCVLEDNRILVGTGYEVTLLQNTAAAADDALQENLGTCDLSDETMYTLFVLGHAGKIYEKSSYLSVLITPTDHERWTLFIEFTIVDENRTWVTFVEGDRVASGPI